MRYYTTFKSGTIEKQGIINLCCFNSKRYTSVVVNDSEIAFPDEIENAVFYIFLYCFWLYTALHN